MELEFGPVDWSVPQTIELSAPRDSDSRDDSGDVTLAYRDALLRVPVEIIDDDEELGGAGGAAIGGASARGEEPTGASGEGAAAGRHDHATGRSNNPSAGCGCRLGQPGGAVEHLAWGMVLLGWMLRRRLS